MEPILAGLARFVARVPHDAIPGAVRDHAALVVADTVGAILGGSQEPEIRRLHAGADRAAGLATLLGAGFVRVEPQVDQPFGEFDRPYPEPALREKFVALAGPDLGPEGARSAWELCRRVDELKSARELTNGLRTLALSRPPH